MLAGLTDFAGELREIGIPVSMVEVLDAAEALRYADLGKREAVRATLSATMVKHVRHQDVFDLAFDVFFGPTRAMGADDEAEPAEGPLAPGSLSQERNNAAAGSPTDIEELFEAMVGALTSGDDVQLAALAQQAVDQLSGFQAGRPVGGRYYLYRVMHRLDLEKMRGRLLEAAMEDVLDDPLGEQIANETADGQVDRLRTEVEQEILRRLVADRGPQAVAQTLRRPLVEDLDLMHATREELELIAERVGPLARKLASRMSAQRRRGHKGRLDVRRTIRRSLAYGGALVEPQWKPRKQSKPELVLLCDVSGSMATFARFTMQLTYAISHQFSNVRSFAFIDGLDDVTRFFGPGEDFDAAMVRMGQEANLIRQDGHSDYGAALTIFGEDFMDAITPKSTVIITGDARNNYRMAGTEVLERIAERARAVVWLNPEAKRYWNTGDSIMRTYEPHCDGLYEVRTLRQLERFVETVALSRTKGLVRL